MQTALGDMARGISHSSDGTHDGPSIDRPRQYASGCASGSAWAVAGDVALSEGIAFMFTPVRPVVGPPLEVMGVSTRDRLCVERRECDAAPLL